MGSRIYRIFVETTEFAETTESMELRMPVSFDQVLELVSRLELTEKQRMQLVEVIREKAKPETKPLTAQQKEFVDDMKQALREVELHQQGKLKLQSMEEFMKEFEVEHREYWRKKDKKTAGKG